MRFSIRGKIGDFDLEIAFDVEDEFEDAVQSFARLRSRYRVTASRQESSRLWILDGETRRISEDVKDSIHRMAISLLELYPKTKPPSKVAAQVGLTSGAVSNYLAGRFTDKGYMFQKRGNGWTLSDRGVEETVSEIVPMYTSKCKTGEHADTSASVEKQQTSSKTK